MPTLIRRPLIQQYANVDTDTSTVDALIKCQCSINAWEQFTTGYHVPSFGCGFRYMKKGAMPHYNSLDGVRKVKLHANVQSTKDDEISTQYEMR